MIKKSNDGITFDNTVFLSEERNRKFPLYMRLLQAAVIFIGSYCFVTIFTGAIDLQYISSQLIISIIISGSVIYILLLFLKYDFIKAILVLLIYGGLIYYRYERLKNGFYLLENAIIKHASFYYNFPEFSFVANRSTADEDITLLLIIIIIPVVIFLTISLLRSKWKLLSYTIMLFPVIVSLAVGVTPHEVDLLALMLVFLFILISNGFSHAKSSPHDTIGKDRESMIYRISIRSASIFCLATLLLFFILKQFVPVEKYKSYKGIDEAKARIQSVMMEFPNYDIADKLRDIKWNARPSRKVSPGGLNLGKLGSVDQVSFDDTEHLQVTAPLQSIIEGIYLKGYIGSEYTGDSWETHSRQTRKSYAKMMEDKSQEEYNPATGSSLLLCNFPYRFYVNQGRIDINYINANKNYAYAPYFTIFREKDGVSFDNDLAAVSDKDIKQASYDYSYNVLDITECINTDFGIPSETNYSQSERIYREFVYDTYMKLPEEGLNRLKHDFSGEQVGSAAENLQDAIEYVKDYLSQFTYTLSPGRLPKGKDFVEYFLYENKIGYCSHFASAGALMLRAMGYPSRYVEGYAISRSDLMNQVMISYIGDETDIVEIVVKDYNAHAWVEVYIDGFGWIPVEFTIGSGMEDVVDAIGGIDQPLRGNIEGDSFIPTDKQPSPTLLPEEDTNPSAPELVQDEDVKGSGLMKKDDANAQTEYLWYLGAALLLVILSGAISYSLLISKRNKDMTDEGYSKKALRLYKKVESLFILNQGLPKKSMSLEEEEEYAKEHLTLVSVEEFEACMESVRKARFGKESISPMEYMKVERFYENLRNRIYEGLPLIKKAYFKILQKTS